MRLKQDITEGSTKYHLSLIINSHIATQLLLINASQVRHDVSHYGDLNQSIARPPLSS